MKTKGMVQASLVAGYIALIGLFINKGNAIFGKAPNYLGPVVFLLLFSCSALICGLLVFREPYLLFFDNKKKQAIDLVLYTTLWLFAYFLFSLLLVIIF